MDNIILLIETATPVCSVAIAKNDVVLDFIDSDTPNLHANQLTVYVQNLLSRNQLVASNLSAVGVSMGPGSYTGLRIGVSVAKGLCYALGIPLIAINTLDAMVAGFIDHRRIDQDYVMIPMIDARRMEVYCANYSSQGLQLSPTEARIIDSESFDQLLQTNVKLHLFGSGADKFLGLFLQQADVLVSVGFTNSARYLATKAFEKFANQDFEDLVYFEPFYLKEFVTTVSKKTLL